MIKRLVSVFPIRTSFAIRFHILSAITIKRLNEGRVQAEDFSEDRDKKPLICWNRKTWSFQLRERGNEFCGEAKRFWIFKYRTKLGLGIPTFCQRNVKLYYSMTEKVMIQKMEIHAAVKRDR